MRARQPMLKLVFKLFRTLIRTRAFTLLLLSLVVATASITAISIFVERIDNTLYAEASAFIAADGKIQGSLPPKEEWRSRAQSLGLRQAETKSFRAMVFAGENMILASVKAVDSGYPLRGELQLGDTLTTSSTTTNTPTIVTTQHGPEPGTAWLAPRLFNTLGINPGETVKIGNANFVASMIIIKEPDNIESAFGMAPRAMIHIDNIASTGALQVGSRVNHSLMFAGDNEAIAAFQSSVDSELGEHWRWISPEDGSAAFGSALEKARRFLLLAGSLSVLLACVAIALAAHHFALQQHTQVALLKTFGLTPARVQTFYLLLLALLATSGYILGSTAGWLLHHGLLILLANLLPPVLASAGFQPFLLGALTCSLALFAFAGPPLMKLRAIAPAEILRSESEQGSASAASIGLGIFATSLLIAIYSQDLKVTAVLVGTLAIGVLASALVATLLLKLTKRLQGQVHGVWRLGLSNLQRHKQFTALQIFVFASVALLILVLTQLRSTLTEQWQPQVAETPNHYVFNIFQDDLDDIQHIFTEQNVKVSTYYPMSRGRLIQVNGEATDTRILPKQQRTNYDRELNLTWSPTLGSDNTIEKGAWWTEEPIDHNNTDMQVSAEFSYADGLGLEIGDTLRFSIAGQELDAKLTSIRNVQWDTMNPNFYMIFDRPIANDFAANWVTSFYLPKERKDFLIELTSRYPTLSLFELDQTLEAITEVLNRVTRAIEFILFMVLGASVLVMLTSIQSSLGERLRESALLRSFGAPRSFVQSVLLVEFASIGFLAGVFACVGAEACLYFVRVSIFDMPATIHWIMWLTTPWVASVLIALLGYLATVSTTRIPPLQVLRTGD